MVARIVRIGYVVVGFERFELEFRLPGCDVGPLAFWAVGHRGPVRPTPSDLRDPVHWVSVRHLK